MSPEIQAPLPLLIRWIHKDRGAQLFSEIRLLMECRNLREDWCAFKAHSLEAFGIQT